MMAVRSNHEFPLVEGIFVFDDDRIRISHDGAS
jgi:hypothetical protein